MTPKDAYVTMRLDEIQNAIQKATAWGGNDPELAACLAAYLVVMISGVYEDCIERLVLARAQKTGDHELANLVERRLGQTFRNPNSQEIMKLLKDFSPQCLNKYKGSVGGSAKSALDSIVSNKNWLAHGDTSRFHVSMGDVQDYYTRPKLVIEVVEEILA